jgi:uridylate kinase
MFEIDSRDDLHKAQRIVLKAGTSVVSNPDGFPSLTRIANIVESASRLAHEGKQVMLVTSGKYIFIYCMNCINIYIYIYNVKCSR